MRKWEVVEYMLDKLVEVEDLEKYKEDIVKAKEIAKKMDKTHVVVFGEEQPLQNIVNRYKRIFDYRYRNKDFKIALIVLYTLLTDYNLCVAYVSNKFCNECPYDDKEECCMVRDLQQYKTLAEIVRDIIKHNAGLSEEDIDYIAWWCEAYVKHEVCDAE